MQCLLFAILSGSDCVLARTAENAILILVKSGYIDAPDLQSLLRSLAAATDKTGTWIALAAVADGGKQSVVWREVGESRMIREVRPGTNASG